jgi:signal peptide peptidase SppA
VVVGEELTMLLLETFLRSDVLAIERPAPARGADGAIAVIPLTGLMFYRSGFFASLLGWKGTADIARAVREASANPGVKALLLDVDSPGGEVAGTEELAAAIADAAQRKPVTAAVNTMAASAAVWAISGASTITITPSGQTGSVGVLAVHDDLSQMAEKAGIKRTYVSAGKYKTAGNPFEPLSAEARSDLQATVDTYYAMMVDRIASGRGVAAERVRTGFGEGRMVGAREAVARRRTRCRRPRPPTPSSAAPRVRPV